MAVRYIGSKSRLVEAITPLIGTPGRTAGRFVDAFCGTGVVAEAAARQGWRVRLNDHLVCAVVMAQARLTTSRQARFRRLGGYRGAVALLNAAPPVHGFIWREYSPASLARAHVGRMYFTEANAARIDGVRRRIAEWRDESLISEREERLLLADLLAATNGVANIAGTYGCYLSHWLPQAREPLALRARKLFPRPVAVETTVDDVSAVQVDWEDVVYLDPPYTKRQYAAYYHVLETITLGDEPEVGGKTGLRPWQAKASDFCYRVRALRAIVGLVERLPARRVLLSYSDQGHVPLRPLAAALASLGELRVIPLREVGRYRPNQVARDAGAVVTEHLLVVERRARSRASVARA
jgi:adenine-specific DNA-methyltransferase